MITEKENYLRCYQGEMPLWVPRFGDAAGQHASFGGPGLKAERSHPACASVRPSFLNRDRTPDGGGCDIWGVEYTPTDSMGGAALPTPGKYLIKDIEKWRDYIKVPDISGIDWGGMAEKDLGKFDREQTVIRTSLHSGYFQSIVDMMGYEEGLTAFYTHPQEVKELLQLRSDFFVEVTEKLMQYYKPDIFAIADDLATAQAPFISLDIYREFIKPHAKRELDVGLKYGAFLDIHCCGKADIFVEDWLEMGINSWNPAQVSNDLAGIKRKFGDRLIFVGCWDSQGPAGWLDTGEEETKAAVRRSIDSFADNGRYIFWASVYGVEGDERAERKARWISEEYESYGRRYYENRAEIV